MPHNTTEDGAVEIIAATGDAPQNSSLNIDYTLTCNGMKLMDKEQTLKSIAYSYANVDPAVIEDAYKKTDWDGGQLVPIEFTRPHLGEIKAEDGMGPALSEKRDILYDTAVSASVEDFDSVWDFGMQDYLDAGGQAIMDEREEKWNAAYGDAEMVP